MKLRIFLIVLIVIVAGGLFVWYLNDDPELPRTPENLAGTWHLVREEGGETMYGRKCFWVIEYRTAETEEETADADEQTYYEVWEFGTDHVFVKTEGCGEQTLQTEYYGYDCSNDTIVLQDRDRTSYRIEKLTASQLVLSETTVGSYGECDWILTYERPFQKGLLR